jgi:hypothetical protein
MSKADLLDDPAPPRRRRRWPWLLLVPLLLVAAAVGYYVYAGHVADRELAEVIAETDRTDPDWRLEQIEAARKTYASEDNAAETVLAAFRLLPAAWPPPAPPPAAHSGAAPPADDGSPGPDDYIPPAEGNTAPLDERLTGLPPEAQLDAALARDLRAELARGRVKDALAATEPLSRQTGGRYAIDWAPNPLMTKTPYQDARPVVALLRMQAQLQDQDGQADEALGTIRRMIVAGRSIGDEPTLVALLVRIAVHAISAQAVERALAQGEPSAEALAQTQRLLAEDAAEPLLLYALRGERAMQYQMAEALKSGRLTDDQLAAIEIHGRAHAMVVAFRFRRGEPSMLRTLTTAVEIASREPEDQEVDGMKLDEYLTQAGRRARLADDLPSYLFLPAYAKVAEVFPRDRANLRGAIVGLALERFRRAEKRWPAGLKELLPAYLPAVPRDPFDGREMRYRRLPDGAIVYSVGPDGQDNGGALNRDRPTAKGTDLGFRLWDESSRRQPAAEALPSPSLDFP